MNIRKYAFVTFTGMLLGEETIVDKGQHPHNRDSINLKSDVRHGVSAV